MLTALLTTMLTLTLTHAIGSLPDMLQFLQPRLATPRPAPPRLASPHPAPVAVVIVLVVVAVAAASNDVLSCKN